MCMSAIIGPLSLKQFFNNEMSQALQAIICHTLTRVEKSIMEIRIDFQIHLFFIYSIPLYPYSTFHIYQVPERDLSSTPGYIAPKLHSNPEMEQIVTLTLTGHLHMKTFGIFLGKFTYKTR